MIGPTPYSFEDFLNSINSRFCFISFSQFSRLYVDLIDWHSASKGSTSSETNSTESSLTEIIPVFTRCVIPLRKSDSVICPSAHQPALFFTQAGILSLYYANEVSYKSRNFS